VHVKGNDEAMGGKSLIPANAYLDFFWNDNRFSYPRAAGCWESNGTVYTPNTTGMNTIRPLMHAAFAQQAAIYHSYGLLYAGNFDISQFYGNTTNPPTVDAVIAGKVDLPNWEAPLGQYFSRGNSLSWSQLVQAALNFEQLSKNGPSGCAWIMEGAQDDSQASGGFPTTQSSWTAAQWQAARYQIGMVAMLNWILNCYVGDTVLWFDEFDSGVGKLGWLGPPLYTGANRILAPTNGPLVVIPFTNGKVYLYPNQAANDTTTSGAQYTLNGISGHHITYTVTPSGSLPYGVTSGAAFTSLTMNARDAVFTLP
jgi:hypothetical protein